MKIGICIRWILIISFWANFCDARVVGILVFFSLSFDLESPFTPHISIKWLMLLLWQAIKWRQLDFVCYNWYGNLAAASPNVMPPRTLHNYKCKFYANDILFSFSVSLFLAFIAHTQTNIHNSSAAHKGCGASRAKNHIHFHFELIITPNRYSTSYSFIQCACNWWQRFFFTLFNSREVSERYWYSNPIYETLGAVEIWFTNIRGILKD